MPQDIKLRGLTPRQDGDAWHPMLRGLLFDLDGVLYVGDRPIPGAAEAVAWASEAGLPCLFVTNTTSRPRAALVAKLADMGITVPAEAMLTPAVAARVWLQAHGLRRPALFVAETLRSEFAVAEDGPTDGPDTVDAVVLGDLGTAWDFHTLNRAFRLLMATEPPCPLVALGMTRYWRAADGLRLDTGPFVKALEYATGREAVVLGKPAPAFFDAALERIGLPAEQVLMIGDDIRSDIGGAHDAGIDGLLVRTGKYRDEDLSEAVRPRAVLDSIADLPQWWVGQARS